MARAATTRDDGPARYYYYDHDQKKAEFLFTDREKMQGQPLAKMVPVIIKSRDGLDLVSYYTLPLGSDRNGDGCPSSPCLWSCTCTAGHGPGTHGALIPFISGWQKGATLC